VSHAISTARENPLVDLSHPIPFDLIRPEHVVPGIRSLIEECEARLERLEASVQPTWEGVVQPLEEIGERLGLALVVCHHLHGVKNSEPLREAVRTIDPEAVRFSLRVGQSRPVFEALRALREGPNWSGLDTAQRRIVEALLLKAKHLGAELSPPDRARLGDIKEELTRLGTTFANNLLDATKAFFLHLTTPEEVAGLPASLKQLAAQAARDAGFGEATADRGPWRILLNSPFSGPFLAYSDRRDLRERVYRASITRASESPTDNTPLTVRILELRREMAKLLGYRSFAELSLATKMAPSVEHVLEKLEELRTASFEPAKRDLAALDEFAREETGGAAPELAHWDVRYWVERQQARVIGFRDEELRPYFQLPIVLDGLFHLAERLFGVRIRPSEGRIPVWHDDVRVYHITSERDEHIATFYLDPYARPQEKQGGAWQSGVINRRRSGSSKSDVRAPVAIFVCNQSPPVDGSPSLMSFTEVRTLFHEFGHALQSLLTTVDYALAAGNANVEWDAIELPSQFMENWCYDAHTLGRIGKHVGTGEPLPRELIAKITSSRTFRAASNLSGQLYYAFVDLGLHGPGFDPRTMDPCALARTVAERTIARQPLPEDRMLCAFTHIFSGGYAAGYYSYLWANVLSADAFAAFEELGFGDETELAAMGRRFRDTVLAAGGARHPLDVFRDFRGRDPSSAALLRHLGLAS